MNRKKEKWMVYTKRADFKALASKFHIDQVTARIMVNRGITEENMQQYLYPQKKDLYDPHLLKDVDLAAERIQDAILKHEKIRIIGDYDIDGINATYILYKALHSCQALVDYAIPHRITDGYGINPRLVEEAKKDNIQWIITCDNGIAASEAMNLAKEKKIHVIITDHHQVPFEEINGERQYKIPPADAVVNPAQADCQYPCKAICGAVVAWKLVLVLYEKMKKPEESAWEFLENAAFATVGDVMPLQDENRTIVKLGLQQMKHTGNVGLQELMFAAGIAPDTISSYHLGFVLGPCMNATGRLESADAAVCLLLEQDRIKARDMAENLQKLNEQRKKMTEDGVEAARTEIEKKEFYRDPVLVVYVENLHESVAGIVAGRIRQEYEKPVFILCEGADCVKGSGRSIEAYPMFQKLQEAKELLLKFGGHPMAAGLSIEKKNVDKLRVRLNQNANLTEEDFVKKVMIDVPMPLSYLNQKRIEELDILEPFGNKNEKPVFADNHFQILKISFIGKNKQYLKMKLLEDKHQIDALYFGDAGEVLETMQNRYGENEVEKLQRGQSSSIALSITYYPGINEFQGRKTMQIIIMDYACI